MLQVLHERALYSLFYSTIFALAAIVDLVSSAKVFLLASRWLGLVATIVAAWSLFRGFTPDYVDLLDFSHTLCRCGEDFCEAVSSSTRVGFSSVMVAQAGATFVPILINLPWTLGRVAFFLSIDQKHADTDAPVVGALTWGALACIAKLTVLPVTVAYIYHPSGGIIALYLLFLGGTSFVLLSIVYRRTLCCDCRRCGCIARRRAAAASADGTILSAKERCLERALQVMEFLNQKNLLWYFCWSLVVFLL